jgi:hypothetical protein
MNNDIFNQIYKIILDLFGYMALILVFIEVLFAGVIIKQIYLLDELLGTRLSPFLKIFAYAFLAGSIFIFLYSITIFIK